MIDVSDGLIADLRHIAHASGVAVHLETSRVIVDEPVAQAAAAYSLDPLEWVLTGGDDHAFAATFPASAELPEGFVAMGRIKSSKDDSGENDSGENDSANGGGVWVNNRLVNQRGGHEHFRGA